MVEENLTPDLDEEIDEESESMDVLKDMVNTLNELPTDVLKQLLQNFDEVDKYNETHPLDGDTAE